MEAMSDSRAQLIMLSEEQEAELRSTRTLTLALEERRQTKVTLNDAKSLLTVLTTFEEKLTKSAELLRALNEANKKTTAGAFIYQDNNEVGLRTTTFYIVEEGELPEPQIIDIVRNHYTTGVEELYTTIRNSSRQ